MPWIVEAGLQISRIYVALALEKRISHHPVRRSLVLI